MASLATVHDPAFPDAFDSLVSDHGVTQVHAAAHTVHAGPNALLTSHAAPDIRIINPSPWDEEMTRWRELFDRAEAWRARMRLLAPGAALPDTAAIAGIIHTAFGLFGESYDDKLASLLACLSLAPDGDVVEIGALFGRSASVLIGGRCFGGADRRVFVFDPWRADAALQDDLPAPLRAGAVATDWALVADACQAALSPLAGSGRVAVLQGPSAAGAAWYAQGDAPATHGLRVRIGSAEPRQSIALLHIDGNHDAAAVMQDAALWTPFVAPGGWVVFDDYQWRYGDD